MKTTFQQRFVKGTSWVQLLACAIMLCFVLIGCSGGGDGGGGGGTPSLTYSGLETPVTITEDNAAALTTDAMDAGGNGDIISVVAALDDGNREAGTSRLSTIFNITAITADAIKEIGPSAGQAPDMAAAVESESETISGSCGGTATITGTMNTDTGALSGSLSFSNFCEDSTTLNGGASFSGFMDVYSYELESMTMSFNSITATSGSESVTMDGEVDMMYSASTTTTTTTMDMVIRDNTTGRTCKLENYQTDVTGYSTTTVDINGRYYDPDYGYVDIETTTPFTYDYFDTYPSSGVLELTGEEGSAGGPTMARLTALSATQCRLEADTNGDGTYDYNSGIIPWTEL